MPFNLFINGLELRLNSEVVKLANDIKLFRMVNTKADCEELQDDLSKLGEWESI